jgi:hypothetical protein
VWALSDLYDKGEHILSAWRYTALHLFGLDGLDATLPTRNATIGQGSPYLGPSRVNKQMGSSAPWITFPFCCCHFGVFAFSPHNFKCCVIQSKEHYIHIILDFVEYFTTAINPNPFILYTL